MLMSFRMALDLSLGLITFLRLCFELLSKVESLFGVVLICFLSSSGGEENVPFIKKHE